jgi:opacity protein-like surface antigen
MNLLDSLLQRGLIAQSDYEEQKSRILQAAKKQTIQHLSADQVAPNGQQTPGGSAAQTSSNSSAPIMLASNNTAGASGTSGSGHDAREHGGNHFAGPYLVISNEWKRGSVKVDGEKITKSEAAPSFGAGYTFAISDRYTLGLKATMDLKKGEYGAGEVSSRSGETKVLEKSHYSLALEPGYVVNDKTLVFGILAYHTAQTEIEDGASSARVNGIGYGIGFKRSLTDHLFLMGELQHVDYSSKSVNGNTLKPSSTTSAVGVGYHF